jgi:signal transduction histidine kinase
VGARTNSRASDVTGGTEYERLAFLIHEVKSPTAALAAIAAALSDDGLDEAATRDLVGLAIAACKGIERIVGDAALGPLRLEDVEVAGIAREAVAVAALGGARIRVVIPSGLPVVRGDALRLRQALDNLIANAVSYSPPAAEVVVSAVAHEAEVLVAVEDLGTGIPVEQHARIFEPGVRLDVGRPGSGLGLAIARAIAEAHEGTVTVDSAPGAGATFTLRLPALRR